jgi:hypothetical protein
MGTESLVAARSDPPAHAPATRMAGWASMSATEVVAGEGTAGAALSPSAGPVRGADECLATVVGGADRRVSPLLGWPEMGWPPVGPEPAGGAVSAGTGAVDGDVVGGGAVVVLEVVVVAGSGGTTR